jgi:hypothetical protein
VWAVGKKVKAKPTATTFKVAIAPPVIGRLCIESKEKGRQPEQRQ